MEVQLHAFLTSSQINRLTPGQRAHGIHGGLAAEPAWRKQNVDILSSHYTDWAIRNLIPQLRNNKCDLRI
jgi:hypothetical protein